MRDRILGFKPLDGRICKIRVKGKYNNLTFICIYAPTETGDGEESDIFYYKLEEVCSKTNRYDMLIILGDFNAKVGRENFIKTVAGNYSLHEETSPNELRLCQMVKDSEHSISTKEHT